MTAGNEPVFVPWTPPRRKRPQALLAFLWTAWRDPLSIWSERHFREPQIFGGGPFGDILVVSHPQGVRHVLTENAANYEKGALQRRTLGPLLADGLLLAEGEAWRRSRRLLAPLFTPARTAALARSMAEVCRARVESWRLTPEGRILDLDSEMSGLTFDILSVTLFSNELGGEAEGFERALNQYLDQAARFDPLDVLGAPAWLPRLRGLTGARSAVFFEDRVSALVAARRALIDGGAPAPPDLLSALLTAHDADGSCAMLDDREVAANILTFILAGHETTARTLGWTLHLLSRTPDILARLQSEADAVDLSGPDWTDALPWTRAVLDESMRLFPPAPVMARLALGPDVIGGQTIRAGANVIVAPWILHRHEALWDDPEAFRPERFLPENRRAVDRYAYLPFSAGPRVCIGAAFAVQEALIALVAILARADLEALPGPEPVPVHQITLRSRKPIRLKLRARR